MAAAAAPNRATAAKVQIIRRFFMRGLPFSSKNSLHPFQLVRTATHECELFHVSRSLDADRGAFKQSFFFAMRFRLPASHR